MKQRAVKSGEFAPLQRDERFPSYFHTLSHDLRTPLNHINGFAELLSLDDGLAQSHKEYADAIMTACGALNNVVLAHLQLIERSFCNDAEPTAALPDSPPAGEA